jgi:hypothetical protein
MWENQNHVQIFNEAVQLILYGKFNESEGFSVKISTRRRKCR